MEWPNIDPLDSNLTHLSPINFYRDGLPLTSTTPAMAPCAVKSTVLYPSIHLSHICNGPTHYNIDNVDVMLPKWVQHTHFVWTYKPLAANPLPLKSVPIYGDLTVRRANKHEPYFEHSLPQVNTPSLWHQGINTFACYFIQSISGYMQKCAP